MLLIVMMIKHLFFFAMGNDIYKISHYNGIYYLSREAL